MTKLYFIGDTHFGRKYPYLMDYELNISKRNLDVIDNCEKIVQDAISNKANQVIFLGDVYDRKIISPTIRKIVRKRIFDPLLKANIPVLIIGGNHDSSRNPRRGVDLEDLSSYPNVEVFTSFSEKIIRSDGTKIGILCLPYIHYDVLISLAQENGYLIPENLGTHSTAQTIVQTYISQMCEDILKDCDYRILIGHYYLKGSKFRETSNPSTIYGEFQLNQQMIQKQHFDLVMFGHVHLRQTLYDDDRIVVLGSSDRIHMGERDTNKYYAVYEPETDTLEFVEIPCRSLLKLEIDVPKGASDLTGFVLQYLPNKTAVEHAVCQVSIRFTRGKTIHIDRNAIEEYFSNSFYTNINYIEQSEDELQHLRNANLSPQTLFIDFMQQKYHENEYYDDLLKVGSELIESQLKTIEVTEKGALSIRSVDLQNFNKYGKGPNKITFDKELYVIKGPTGTGKSSILDAITFALFKRSMRRDAGLNIDEILYEDGYVDVELSIGDNILRIKRSTQSPKLEIFLNHTKPFQGMSIPEKEKKLEDILGYDYEGFISSFFIRQQELQIFSSLPSAERQKRLAKLFKLKVFQNMDKTLKTKIEKISSDHNKLEGQIGVHQEDINSIPRLQQDLITTETSLKQIEKYIQQQTKKVKDTKTKLVELEPQKTKCTNISLNIDEIEKSIILNDQDLKNYNQKQSNYQKVKNQLKEFKDVSKELNELRKRRDELKDKIATKNLLESQVKNEISNMNRADIQYENQIQKVKIELQNLQSRLKALSSDMNKDQAFNLLKKVGMLTERLSRLENIEIPMAKEYSDVQKVTLFEKTQKETRASIVEVESQQDLITKDIFIADELNASIHKLQKEIAELEKHKKSELDSMKLKKETLQKEIRVQKLDENIPIELKELDQKLTLLEQKQKQKEDLEQELASLQDYGAVIQKTKEDGAKFAEKLKSYREELRALKPIYDAYQEIFGKLERDEQELNNFEANKEGVKVRIEFLKKDIQKLQELKKKIQTEKKILSDLKREIEVHTILRKQVFHLDGIPKFALDQILPAISIRASQILSDLTDGRLNHIEFLSTDDHRVGFDIFVNDGEKNREAGTFSGGEKTQINASIRFAIMEKIDEIPDTTGTIFRKSNTLFIDEGDLGTLDDDSSRQLFVEKIMEMKSRFKTIILITHLEDVAEQFPNHIKIGRTEAGKSKIMS